jgi:glycosyltransferase involved in cell wall biosynthesis
VITVLMNAGPWLPVPPMGYGGIENVIATLVPQLRRRGVKVVLATVADSRLPVEEQVCVFERPQFGQLLQPYNQVVGVAHAHMHRVVAEARQRDDIDIVHDHMEVVGLGALSAMGPDGPPVLQTLHWDLGKHQEFYSTFEGGGRMFVNGVSVSQLERAPMALLAHSVGHVYLSTPLVGRAPRPKGAHSVVVGRITRNKGQHIAARLAHRLGRPLLLAGPVGPYRDRAALTEALSRDTAVGLHPDVRYWCDEVADYVDETTVRWVGTPHGVDLERLVATARAALFPVQWEEPGGTAVVEALALGTPVIGYRRGCLPELVEPGHTGLLADPGDEAALGVFINAADSIDPVECCRVAAKRFAPSVMADRYLELYQTATSRTGTAYVETRV